MIIICTSCGGKIERKKETARAKCFNCKKKEQKEYALTRYRKKP